MIPYGHQYIDRADARSVSKSLQSDWLTQGPMIEKFENAFGKKVSAKYAIACSNGTATLHLACLAAGIGPGDEVIVPTLSFAASANCVAYCGGTPVLCDIKLDTLTIDPKALEKKITARTKAVIGVDFAGKPADWDELKIISKSNRLVLIADAAHALGAKYKGKTVGSIADLTTFSFHPVKAITTGEGGMIVTDNKQFADKMKLLRSHGITKSINHQPSTINHSQGWYQDMVELGYNYRLTDFQAALGLSQMTRLDKFLKRRREIAFKYIQAFGKIQEIILPPHGNLSDHAWHIFPIQFRTLFRDKIYADLLSQGIKCQVHYWPIHLQTYYKRTLGYKVGDFPQAEKYASRCLTIPLYPSMTDKMIDKVILTVQEAAKRGK